MTLEHAQGGSRPGAEGRSTVLRGAGGGGSEALEIFALEKRNNCGQLEVKKKTQMKRRVYGIWTLPGRSKEGAHPKKISQVTKHRHGTTT